MGIDTAAKKVQINKLVRSQVPSFVAEDNPLFIDFLKQYYISEEAKGKSIDIISNFNDYQKADTYSETYNLIGFTTCTGLVNSYDATINVSSTDGWPSDYGLLKIDDEIITYTGITSTSFTGCIRGFCGVDNLKSPTDPESLVFSTTNASKHENTSRVINLSNLFLQEFWQKTKKLFLPGFEDRKLHNNVDKANFLRQAKDFYGSKGTDEAIKILFGVLFDQRAEVIKPIEYLFAPSDADYVKTNDLMAERISGNAQNVVGQTLFQTDAPATSGSIFNVQYAPRDGRDYYIISLSKGSIVGTFEPTGSSSLVNAVGIGSTVVTVDSTLGFPEKGELYVGAGLTVGIATYTNKTSTQFFGVSGISSNYSDSDFVRSSKTVFAYENGDVSKPVFFRLTNVATDVNLDNIGFLQVDDIIKPRQLGKVTDPSNHQVNSWIDNIKTKIDVARDIKTSKSKVNTNSSVVTTTAPHFLTPNDTVILLDVTGDDQNPDNVEGIVERVINDLEFQINISSGSLNPSKIYKVQRELNFATSLNSKLRVSDFVADVQNTYISEDNKQVYVATGSLPSYEIKSTNRTKSFVSAAPIFNSDVDNNTNNITIIDHKFMNGELVRYIPSDTNQVVGLSTGSIYAVKIIDNDTIQLARSIADVATDKVISITGIGSTTTHELIPSVLYEKNIKHQNFLRRFPMSPEPSEYDTPLQTDPIGMFVNGVEILSNRSSDSVHFGSIRRIDVESGGKDYDVITPPNIHISDTVGTGATAYAIVEGSFKGIDILSGGYDIKTVPNVVITGGNGSGATAKARLKATKNSRLFDAKDNVGLTATGVPGTITFNSSHLFFDGETVVYEKSTSNNVIGGLVDKSIYYVHRISDTQISLMTKFADAVAGINSVSLTSKSVGSHKFTSTTFRNVVDKIIIDNPGSGYSNRKVLVDSNEYPSPTYFTRDDLRSGISTANNYLYFENHGFKSGELVEYKIVGVGSTAISGLSTNYSYYVNRLDENKFRLSYAGLEGGRTNIVANSEDIDGSVTVGPGNYDGTLTADVEVTTPSGGTKAYTLTGKGSNSVDGVNLRVDTGTQDGQSVGLKTDTHYVFSAFVKKAGHRYVKVSNAKVAEWVDPEGGITLDFDTGSVHRGITSHASGVISYPNGWYRIWWEDKTVAVGNGTNGEIKDNAGWYIWLSAGANGVITNVNLATNVGCYVWGLQAEETTNYPTEYIPTNGAPKTVDTIGSIDDYFKGKYVDIGSNIGVGCTHIFKYPDIKVELKTLSGEPVDAVSEPILRPLCHGPITDVFLSKAGQNYGSGNTINAHRRPLVQISNGTNALVTVGIANGEINRASVKIKGKGYVSPPQLLVSGEGKYARLISNVASDGTLSGVNIIDGGKNYTEQPATTVRILQQGSGAVFRADLKRWNNTTLKRYQKHINQDDDGIIVPSQNPEYEAKFASAYLPRQLRLQLKDNIEVDGTGALSELTKLEHSPIVGWAYDGAPIYGPYGYSSATGGSIQRLTSSYTPNLKPNRPSITDFELGFFIEDYDYTADGHLDKYNGRFCKTPEFPDGVYAYFCTMQDADGSTSPFIGSREPTFPYVLNGFKFKKIEMNGQPLSLQDMPILNSGNVLRNTYPYKLGFVGSDYDYLVSNNIDDTELLIKTISSSGIGSVNVLSTGIDYKINDRISFNNSESGGRGASAKVRSLVGKGITQIKYNETTIDDIAFDFRNGMGIGIAATSHGLQNNDFVNISGIDAGGLSFLEGSKTIAISSVTSSLIKVGSATTVALAMRNVTGDTTFITLSDVLGGKSEDDDIQVGDYLTIGSLINEASIHERVKVLEVDNKLNRYKILRDSGISTYFSEGELVSIDQRRFTFPIGINTNFNIQKNKELVFNPQSTIGIGTALVTQSVSESVGFGTTQVVNVVSNDGTILSDHDLPPHIGQEGSNGGNAISIPDHGLFTGQKLRYNSGIGSALIVSNSVGLGNSFSLVDGQAVYAVKKSNNLIGITTTQVASATTSLYITTISAVTNVSKNLFPNREDHSFKTTKKEYLGTVDRYDVIVDTASAHELRTNDRITIDVAPNTIVNKTIEYDTIARKTIVDPKYVNSSNVFTSSSQIKIINHGYKDGDKILYSLTGAATPIWPLVDRGEYYVKRINKNRFRLFDNREDSVKFPSTYIKITGAGSGVHRFARINPPIKALRGQTIGFAVSDTSLSDLQLEFYKDKNFTNKFDGVGIATEIVRTGVAGTTGSIVNVKLTDDLELPLWYKLVPSSLDTINISKRDSEPDNQVINGSKITVDISEYGGNFGIKTTGITSFTYQVAKKPEVTSYVTSGVTTFRYLTSSLNATGGINEIAINFAGKRYIKNPGINTIRTTSGRNADLRMFDSYIGRAGHKEMVKIGYDYATDKSLSPRADTPVTVTVQNNFVIGHIGVETAGRNYSTAPDLFLPDRPNSETEVTLEGTGIGSIRILNDSLTGFDLFPNPPEIYAINNSNGVGVVTAISTGGGDTITNTITLKAPIGGWRPANHVLGTNFPFKPGDEIFVENVNIQGNPVIDSAGDQSFPEPLPSTDPRTYPENEIQGYNSNMYGYRTFTVLPFDVGGAIDNVNTSRIQYSISGIGTYGGFFDPINSAGRVIKKDDLPTFSVRFDHRDFVNGEPITFGSGGAEGQIVKNEGWDRATNSFRIEKLTRTPYVGDLIVGKISRAQGTVVQSSFHEKYFKLDFNTEREKGWQKDTGKPSNDFQKLQDSDYYQNFSYSIQSEVQEKEFTDAVDSIVHPAGFKNFSDLVIKSNTTTGFGRSTTLTARSPQNATSLKVDIDNVASFYVQNDFDFATETTIRTGLSKFITFQNRKIRDLLSISTAKVELIDDISGQFNAKTETFSGSHIFKSATGDGITIISGGSGTLTATTGTSYQAYSGILTIVTTTNHGLSSGAKVRLANNSLVFTCDKDNHSTLHPYPRSSDPASGADLTVTVINATTFTVVTNTPIVGGQIVGLSSFRLTSQSGVVPLYYKKFDPNDSSIVSVGSSVITIFNHGFQTGERIRYLPHNHGAEGYGNNRIGIVTTNHVIGGATTDFMPEEMFVVSKLDNNRFKIAGLSTTGTTEALTLRQFPYSLGIDHAFESLNPESRTLIQIDGMIQSPLTNRSVNLDLINAVGVGSTTLRLQAGVFGGNPVGLTTVKLNDIIQIEDELVRVKTVGFGASDVVSVDRGFLGTKEVQHASSVTPKLKGGNYRIDKGVVHFATPPFGPTGTTGVTTSSTFSGRVFNRRDITRNFIFDDISHLFTGETGAGRTFTLKQNESDVTGIVTTTSGTGGSDEVINYGVILINGIFQRPLVDYDMTPRSVSPNIGIGGKISFSGSSLFDIPRGGKVDEVDPVALGQNYQPRIRAGASAVVNGSGVITGVNMLSAGSGYFSGSVNIEVQNPLGTGTPAVLAATVGTGSSAGMITGINVTSGGSGYNAQFPPVIKVGIATGYTNLSVTGGSGNGLKVDARVGSSGSIIDFNITDRGFSYKNGEVLTVQGIPFRAGVSTSPFTLTVKSTIDDKFAGFSFGQLVPLDDFSSEFNGVKKSFLLTKTTLTKDVVTIASLDTSIDPTNNLLIFINDVLQQPRQNYTLEGGTVVKFVEAPKGGSKLQLLFFRGGNQDIESINPVETVKVGDKLSLLRDLDVPTQTDRVVSEISDISKVETPPYGGGGISTNPDLLRVVSWKKQDKDLIVDGLPIAKDRALQVGNFYPSARLIRNVGLSSVVTYVDNAYPFFSAYDNRTDNDRIPGQIQIINTQEINVARAEATVSVGGTISSIDIIDGGSGYENIPSVSIAKFNKVQSGISTLVFENLPLTQEVGNSWNPPIAPVDINYEDVDYTPEGVFVAVGSTVGIHTSTDGNNWSVSSVTGPTSKKFMSVVGLSSEVVIVGTAGTIIRSTNAASSFTGIQIYDRIQTGFIPTYTPKNITQQLNAVAVGSYIFPGISTTIPQERVVVVGAAGTIVYSEPGSSGLTTSFVVSNKFANQAFNDVAYHDGTFIAVGNQGSIYRSTDGEIWSGVTTTSITTTLRGVHYGEDQWIAVGAASSVISSTDDGLNWSVVSDSSDVGISFQINDVHYENNVWLAVGNSGRTINSINGRNWFFQTIPNTTSNMRGITYGDNKMVAVGFSSAIRWSGYETVGAAATATVGAGGTISAITVNNGGFGYKFGTTPTVLISQEVVSRETINTVNIAGDYGTVVGVAVSSSGFNSQPTLNLTLDADPFLNQLAFNNPSAISKTGLAVGDYFVLRNTVFGTGVTSIDKDGNNVGVGTSFADNIYKVEGVLDHPTDNQLVLVFCNISSTVGITPIAVGSGKPKLGDYSWGKLTNLSRSTDPKVFNINTSNGYTGITTAPEVRRINPLAVSYSDFDKTT